MGWRNVSARRTDWFTTAATAPVPTSTASAFIPSTVVPPWASKYSVSRGSFRSLSSWTRTCPATTSCRWFRNCAHTFPSPSVLP